ncbi:hypothetical protein [Clostridium hydrogenum]|uniref:hypothetical protein n=1 Tax=Clostridium hydrogenum TaxID=2855764 RepID=UPI001F36ACAE|nr:hypothetical protein [Clostridium hydrogenum]
MLRKERFGSIMNFGMNLIIGIVMTTVALNLLHAVSLIAFFQNVILSLGIGYLVGDLLPAVAWGDKLANALGCKNKFLRHLVSSLVIGFCLITVISLICQFIAFGTGMMPIWLKCIPYFYVFGTLAILIAIPIVLKIAILLTGFNPENTKEL